MTIKMIKMKKQRKNRKNKKQKNQMNLNLRKKLLLMTNGISLGKKLIQ